MCRLGVCEKCIDIKRLIHDETKGAICQCKKKSHATDLEFGVATVISALIQSIKTTQTSTDRSQAGYTDPNWTDPNCESRPDF
jgi:hypothetical protein